MLEEGRGSGGGGEDDVVVNLPEVVKGAALARVMEYCDHHHGGGADPGSARVRDDGGGVCDGGGGRDDGFPFAVVELVVLATVRVLAALYRRAVRGGRCPLLLLPLLGPCRSRSLLISLDAQLAAVSFSASAAATRGEELSAVSALEEERLRSGSGTAAAREPGRRRVRAVSSKSSPNTADDWSGCVRLVLRLTDFAGVGLHGGGDGGVGCLPA
uniref:Uncharacterized protein n=1 Tax=Oryza nivara TaxID=4536 RepID=A0A0E0GYV4_ORYNI